MLLTPEDLDLSLNITLSEVGEEVATEQIAAAIALAETIIGYPIEQVEDTIYLSDPDDHIFLPTAAPVYDADEEAEINGITVETFDPSTLTYSEVDSQYVRHHEPSTEVVVTCGLPSGFESTRVTFTSGWTTETLPADLRDALVSLAGFKIKNINNESADEGNDSGALKKVTAGSYTEEFAVTEQSRIGDEIPEEIMAVFRRYRRAWAR